MEPTTTIWVCLNMRDTHGYIDTPWIFGFLVARHPLPHPSNISDEGWGWGRCRSLENYYQPNVRVPYPNVKQTQLARKTLTASASEKACWKHYSYQDSTKICWQNWRDLLFWHTSCFQCFPSEQSWICKQHGGPWLSLLSKQGFLQG